MKSSEIRWDLPCVLLSLAGALLWAFLGGLLYHALLGKLWTPLLIGLYFFGMGLTAVLALKLHRRLRGAGRLKGRDRAVLAGILLGLFLLGGLFEFLYEHGPYRKERHPSSYVFMIDDSGSMRDNDPENRRVEGLKQVLDDCQPQFPVAVYAFTTQAKLLSPMSPAGEQPRNFAFQSYGQTAIVAALSQVLDDLSSKEMDGGPAPRIVLFSDGYTMQELEQAASASTEEVVDRARRMNVSICAVSLVDRPAGETKGDEDLLGRLSGDTGGFAVEIGDMEQLGGTLATLASAESRNDSNLLNRRDHMSYDWAYCLMRIGMLAVLGALILLVRAMNMYTNVSDSFVLPLHAGMAGAGALLSEFGLQTLPEPPVRLLLCLLFMLTVLRFQPVPEQAFWETQAKRIAGKRPNEPEGGSIGWR